MTVDQEDIGGLQKVPEKIYIEVGKELVPYVNLNNFKKKYNRICIAMTGAIAIELILIVVSVFL